jgi:hypothetical protein
LFFIPTLGFFFLSPSVCSIVYPGYTGRSPKTGKEVKTKPKQLPVFRCGKELMDRVDR